jgi:hypothetical protein
MALLSHAEAQIQREARDLTDLALRKEALGDSPLIEYLDR